MLLRATRNPGAPALSRARPRVRTDLVAALVVAGLACASAQAAELYRWTDANGGVVYGDKPPKGAHNVTRIDVDTATTTVPSKPTAAPSPPVAPAPAAQGTAAPAPDLLTQRRLTRARLEEGVAQARARLELARKNLAEATDMAPEEQQSVVEKVADVPAGNAVPSAGVDPGNMQVTKGGMFGMSTNRQNCTTIVGKSGKAGVVCPTIIPNQAYLERIAALEDAVKKAEADLDAAQVAYNRGVD